METIKGKRMPVKKHIAAIIFLVLCSSSAFAANITLPWSTTYMCDEYERHIDGTNPTCSDDSDGLRRALDATLSCTLQGVSHSEQITTAANNPNGGGGKGQRHWFSAYHNSHSGGLQVTLDGTQTEIWVRWYMRYQSGFTWQNSGGTGPQYNKLIYVYTIRNGSLAVGPVFDIYYTNQVLVSAIGGGAGDLYVGSPGWQTINGGYTGDGNWHYYEFHLKLDTNGSNGIVEWWIDDTKVISVTNANLGGSIGVTKFNTIAFGHNQDLAAQTCEYVDYDDVAISNTGRIGQLGPDTAAPTVIQVNATEDSNAVTIYFDEYVYMTDYDTGEFNLDCNTTGTNISLSSPSGGGTTWGFTAASAIDVGDTCNLDFNSDVVTLNSNSIEDSEGNDLATFANKEVFINPASPPTENPPVLTDAGPIPIRECTSNPRSLEYFVHTDSVDANGTSIDECQISASQGFAWDAGTVMTPEYATGYHHYTYSDLACGIDPDNAEYIRYIKCRNILEDQSSEVTVTGKIGPDPVSGSASVDGTAPVIGPVTLDPSSTVCSTANLSKEISFPVTDTWPSNPIACRLGFTSDFDYDTQSFATMTPDSTGNSGDTWRYPIEVFYCNSTVTVYAKCRDSSGNTSNATSISIQIDMQVGIAGGGLGQATGGGAGYLGVE